MNKIIAAILAASFGLAYAMVLPARNPPASSGAHFTAPADDDDAAPPIHIHHTITKGKGSHAPAPAPVHRTPRRSRPASAPQ
ncbi:hypothetical protein [Paludibacterium yongneupense]|uniref:hypothetical protein n=1 Tax=Paludibacterium yongneupense TaxID=400061 RepID=UPI0004038D69|nr:hypothetical protein [Paludibacterium yongneupense]